MELCCLTWTKRRKFSSGKLCLNLRACTSSKITVLVRNNLSLSCVINQNSEFTDDIHALYIHVYLTKLFAKSKMCSYLGKNSVAERANIQNLLQFEGTIQDGETQEFGEWVQN